MPPPLSRGDLDQKRKSGVSKHFSENDGRRKSLSLFPRTGPCSGTLDEGRIFSFSCSFRRTVDVSLRSSDLLPLPSHLRFSKDGSTILDEGRRTGLRLFMLFSEDGERWTFFQALLNQEPGRVASERGTWAQRAGTALLLFRRTALLYSAFHDLFG